MHYKSESQLGKKKIFGSSENLDIIWAKNRVRSEIIKNYITREFGLEQKSMRVLYYSTLPVGDGKISGSYRSRGCEGIAGSIAFTRSSPRPAVVDQVV